MPGFFVLIRAKAIIGAVGIRILGAPGADLLMAQVAYAYEQATGYGKRRLPL